MSDGGRDPRQVLRDVLAASRAARRPLCVQAALLLTESADVFEHIHEAMSAWHITSLLGVFDIDIEGVRQIIEGHLHEEGGAGAEPLTANVDSSSL